MAFGQSGASETDEADVQRSAGRLPGQGALRSLRNLGNYPIVPAPNGESSAATGRCGTSPTSRDIRFGSHMCRLADTEGRDFQI
jgi:hypothetical protein